MFRSLRDNIDGKEHVHIDRIYFLHFSDLVYPFFGHDGLFLNARYVFYDNVVANALVNLESHNI